MLAPVLLIALAWLAWFASREGPAASSLDAPGALRPAARADDVLTPPGSRTTEPAAPPRTDESAAVDQRSTAVAAREVRGVLRDANTGKPIPEVRIAVRRAGQGEVVDTDLDGAFRTERAFRAGRLTIDPFPVRSTDDWYSRAAGAPLEVEYDPRDEDPIVVTVDAPAFVIVEGAEPLRATRERLRAWLVLPGSEAASADGSTDLSRDSLRLGYHPRWLSDGSLLVSPAPFRLDERAPRRGGSGLARIDLSPMKDHCQWFETGPLSLTNDRILDERVRAHERASLSSVVVTVADEDGRAIHGATVELRPLADTRVTELPAWRRTHSEWTSAYEFTAGTVARFGHSDERGVWRSDCVAPGEYEVRALHPLYDVEANLVEIDASGPADTTITLPSMTPAAPIRLRVRWEDPHGVQPALSWRLSRVDSTGEAFDPRHSFPRLGSAGEGTLHAAPAGAEAIWDELPDGHYAVELRADTYSGGRCWPVPVEPKRAVVAGGDVLEVRVRDVELVRWRLESPAELRDLRWSAVLELVDDDGGSAGTMPLQFVDGTSEPLAPLGEGWSYVLRPHASVEVECDFRGAWRATRFVEEHGITRHVLVIE